MSNFELAKLFGIYFADIFAVVAILVYLRDRRKIILSALHFSSKLNDRIEREILSFDKALLAKIVTDENGVISLVNNAAQALLGWAEKELFGKNITTVYRSTEIKKLSDMLNIFNGRMMELRQSYDKVVTKFNVEIETEIFIRKEIIENKFVYLFVFRDRTKEIKTARKLEQVIDIIKRKNDILNTGEELGKSGSWIWDLSNDEITVSDGYKRIMGLDPKGISVYKSHELKTRVWKQDVEKVQAAVDGAFKGQGYEIVYKQMRPSDFMLVTIKSRVKVMFNDERVPIAFMGNSNEISIKPLKEDDNN